MEVISLVTVSFLPWFRPDPAPGLRRGRTSARSLVCETASIEEARELYPGQFPRVRGRGDAFNRRAEICRARLLRPGLRNNRDEAILEALDVRTQELATAAASLRPELAEHTWMVEAYYPSAPVSTKIAFATKNALMGQGLSVSDRTPLLGADDVNILSLMHPREAYPMACKRYHDTGGLQDGDALLAILTRDRRETNLHAGVCHDGRWMWLR